MKNNRLITLLFILVLIGALSFSAGYFLTKSPISVQQTENSGSKKADSNSTTNDGREIPIFPGISTTTGSSAPVADNELGNNWIETLANTVLRLLLAVFLSAILAFRPRKNVAFFQRNLYIAQTQILLAVVAAALMLIVGDNTARAFAIFAAVSLVRFRTNIKDPKEITVLLISLALGLAAGVGKWELGLLLCLFVLALLWLLEYKETEQIFRSMELTIKTRNIEQTQEALKQVFQGHGVEAEVRELSPPDEKTGVGCIMYYMNLKLTVSTDDLNDQITAADPENIDAIQWKQQKKPISLIA